MTPLSKSQLRFKGIVWRGFLVVPLKGYVGYDMGSYRIGSSIEI